MQGLATSISIKLFTFAPITSFMSESEQTTPQATEKSPEHAANLRPKILVVDDSRVMRVSCQKILAKQYRIVEAEDGQAGWDRLQSDDEILMVITDLNMPKMNGHELLHRIRSSDDQSIKALPVIIISGKEDDDAAKQKVLAEGATDFISKPFDSVQLQARANSYINLNQTANKLKEEATDDALTGLGSKAYFDRSATELLGQVQRHGGQFVLVLFDIDGFKPMFISKGKAVALAAIKAVGETTSKMLRTEDKAARIGMSLFAVLATTTDLDGANIFAQRLQEEIQKLPLEDANGSVGITVSMGIYEAPLERQVTLSSVLVEANQCLKQAIQQGKGQIVARSDRANAWPDVAPKVASKETLDTRPSEHVSAEVAETTTESKALALVDLVNMFEKGDVQSIRKQKLAALKALVPILKHIIIDNSMLKTLVDLLKRK